ncbi:hypothetical protein PIB30_067383 [Stylosanthes scabra]|uniref:Uncharacterized protein n=1 Tax=Stylosanthes scabra TaxID=79078 RepID=A0ABU6WP84_9FABA|nr:hypothetical protein [Stylosanthes scabra]
MDLNKKPEKQARDKTVFYLTVDLIMIDDGGYLKLKYICGNHFKALKVKDDKLIIKRVMQKNLRFFLRDNPNHKGILGSKFGGNVHDKGTHISNEVNEAQSTLRIRSAENEPPSLESSQTPISAGSRKGNAEHVESS